MMIDELDRLAAIVAARLDDGCSAPEEVAARAYQLAEGLLKERARRRGGSFAPLIEVLPHDPRWELSPRWSVADRRAALSGPGLASVRPLGEEDSAATGS